MSKNKKDKKDKKEKRGFLSGISKGSDKVLEGAVDFFREYQKAVIKF
jgi:hypothetical protein